jgi:hypothetical protein
MCYKKKLACQPNLRWKQVGELAVIYADEGEGGCVHCVPVGRPSYPTPQYINCLTALTTALMYIDAYLHLLDALAVTKYTVGATVAHSKSSNIEYVIALRLSNLLKNYKL